MSAILPLAVALSVATFGLVLAAPTANAGACVLGEQHEDCLVPAWCSDAACSDVCFSYWYCVVHCNTPPDYYCKCRPECPPPPEPEW